MRILAQDQGGAKSQPAGLLLYFEELRRGPNADIGAKDIFERVFLIFARTEVCMKMMLRLLKCPDNHKGETQIKKPGRNKRLKGYKVS